MRGEQVALLVPDEVAEQAERDAVGARRRRSGARSALAADRDHLARAAPRLDPRHRPRVGEADRRGREGQRLDQRAGATPGTANTATIQDVHARPAAAVAAQRRARSLARAPAEPRGLGGGRRPMPSAGSVAHVSAAGDRPAHDDELGVERQLAHDLRRAVAVARPRRSSRGRAPPRTASAAAASAASSSAVHSASVVCPCGPA